jgi:hypothetical protein
MTDWADDIIAFVYVANTFLSMYFHASEAEKPHLA